MGVIYRAHDEQLERDVALKVLHPGTLTDESARKQFRKEALALAKLNHQGIATVHEFGSQNGEDFLAMELIPGDPLSEKLKAGPLPEPELLRLATQLADGLAAAHERGIVHRDLKPANLFVTPDERLKILDFGLAKMARAEATADMTLSVTGDTGTISGTVPYMSPEQLRGLAADPRSDIYAAGAVLYEMAAGQRAFPQKQGAELMGAILHTSPAPLRSVNPAVSTGLESIVAKAMEKEASQRYQTARELRVALEGYAGGVQDSGRRLQAAPGKTSRAGIVAGCVLLAAVLLAGLAIGINFRGVRDIIFHRNAPDAPNDATSATPAPSTAIKRRRSVAVLGLKNVSGQADKAWLATALSEMLTTELGAGEQLRTVASENVAQMKVNLSLADADAYSPETLQKIHKNLNADEVVVGSYVPLSGNQIRLDLRLQDAVAGETLASVSEKGREDQIDDVVSRAGAELREKLGVSDVTPEDAATVKAALPSNQEAVRLYSQGLAKLRAKDDLAARDLLLQTISLEPNFASAHSALAEAWNALGYDSKATTEAKKAFDLSGELGREDKLAIEARYHEVTHDWDGAIGVYRTLTTFFPDNLEYGLRLASAQDSAGKPKDALETLQALKSLPAPASEDPRIDLQEADSDSLVSDWKGVTVVAARAATKARASGARIVVAQALLREGAGFRYLSDFQKSDAAFREAQGTFAAIGDRRATASATMGLATSAYNRGDLNSARALYTQSLAVFREIGSQHNLANSLRDVAITYYDQGDLAQAQKMYEEALRIEREIDDRDGVAGTLNSIANVLADKGDQAGAMKEYEEALSAFQEMGSQTDVAMTMGNIGELSLDEGDLPEAKKMFEQALEIKRRLHTPHSEAYTVSAIGDLLAFQGDLPGAKKAHEEALAIRTQLGEKGTAAQDSLSLAGLNLEAGHPDEALASARQVGTVFQAEKQADYAALAHELAARCLIALGKLPEARQEIQQAQQLLGKSDNLPARLPVEITDARIAMASGDFNAARRSLDAALAEATKANLLYHQFQARLALGELEIKSGKSSDGRARLAALEKDSTEKGFLLISRKAKAAAGG